MADVSKIEAGSRVRVTIEGVFQNGFVEPDSQDFTLYANVLTSPDTKVAVLERPVPNIKPGDFITTTNSTLADPGWVGLVTKTGYVSLTGYNRGAHENFKFTVDTLRRYKVISPEDASKMVAARQSGVDVEF